MIFTFSLAKWKRLELLHVGFRYFGTGRSQFRQRKVSIFQLAYERGRQNACVGCCHIRSSASDLCEKSIEESISDLKDHRFRGSAALLPINGFDYFRSRRPELCKFQSRRRKIQLFGQLMY